MSYTHTRDQIERSPYPPEPDGNTTFLALMIRNSHLPTEFSTINYAARSAAEILIDYWEMNGGDLPSLSRDVRGVIDALEQFENDIDLLTGAASEKA